MAQLRDLRPISFLDLPLEEAMNIIKEVRFRRRQTKIPVSKKATEKLANKIKSPIGKVTTSDPIEILWAKMTLEQRTVFADMAKKQMLLGNKE